MKNKDFKKKIDSLSTRADELVDKFSDDAVDFAEHVSDKVGDAVEAAEYKVNPKKNKIERFWWSVALSAVLSLAAAGVAVTLRAQKMKKKVAETVDAETTDAEAAHTEQEAG